MKEATPKLDEVMDRILAYGPAKKNAGKRPKSSSKSKKVKKQRAKGAP
jgi:hypothetical protein